MDHRWLACDSTVPLGTAGETEIADHLYEIACKSVQLCNCNLETLQIHMSPELTLQIALRFSAFFFSLVSHQLQGVLRSFDSYRSRSTPLPTRHATSASGSWLSLPRQPPPVWVKFMENWNEHVSEDVFMIIKSIVYLKKIF